ncbi:hypothetical protein [Halorussus lipolyticus]|uniref:hypothetical protein n=1 Tax=Halorussus lipolyticus TaxID=3034024 RepID=UPI0023E7DFFB|nr:hypothetical protein [Halorussus sp. DT80]
MPRDDASVLGAKLDRISYLLTAVVVLQIVELLDLDVTSLAFLVVVGFFVGTLYNADV